MRHCVFATVKVLTIEIQVINTHNFVNATSSVTRTRVRTSALDWADESERYYSNLEHWKGISLLIKLNVSVFVCSVRIQQSNGPNLWDLKLRCATPSSTLNSQWLMVTMHIQCSRNTMAIEEKVLGCRWWGRIPLLVARNDGPRAKILTCLSWHDLYRTQAARGGEQQKQE